MKRKKLKDPAAVGSILDEEFGRLGLKPALSRHRVVDLWPSLVNSTVARHATATRVSGSTLHVDVDSSVWMNELAAIKTTLLEKINRCVDPDAAPITDIRFRAGYRPASSPVERSGSAPPELDENDARMVREALKPLLDKDLRQAFKRVMEKDRRLKRRRGSEDE